MGIMAADGLSWRLKPLLFSSLITRSIWSTCYAVGSFLEVVRVEQLFVSSWVHTCFCVRESVTYTDTSGDILYLFHCH